MSITIPCTDETWDRISKHLGIAGSGPTSFYWQQRRKELQYERDESGSVTAEGLYKRLDKPNWINRDPGPIARMRALLRPNDPRFWREHPLVETWEQRVRQKVDGRLRELFGSYNLTKAFEVVELIEDYAPSHSVLEIGAGACLVAALLLGRHQDVRYTIVDLPETMPVGFLTLRHLFPESPIALPGESMGQPRVRFCSVEELQDGPYGAVVNVASFQELDPPIVANYFRKIDEVLEPNGIFVCINREKKTDPERKLRSVFKEYPWPESYETLLDDEALISRWSNPQIAVLRRVIRKASSPQEMR